jgi:heme exporter protein B
MIGPALAIARKDLLAEFRSKQIITSTLIFSLVVVITFSIALGDSSKNEDWLVPAVLWISFMFGGMMAISRSFTIEKDKNSLEGLLLAPMDRTAIYLGKVISNLILMFIMEIGIIIMVIVFFNYDVPLISFFPILILGTVGFVVVASLLSALSINVKSSEHFLSLILFPILWALIIPVITATRAIFTGDDFSEITDELTVLLMYDIIFFTVSFAVFEFLVED